jgi:hypothetical protein
MEPAEHTVGSEGPGPIEREASKLTSAEYMSRNGPLSDFNQTLRGRQTRLAELDSFLRNCNKTSCCTLRGSLERRC